MALLRILGSTQGYIACDGPNRATAWRLENMGLAEWHGIRWGSYFFGITPEGIKYLQLHKVFGNG